MKFFPTNRFQIPFKMVRHSELRGLYDVEKTIGCGGFAKVKLGTHVATGEKVAIKIMEKGALGEDLPRVKMELNALKTFSHQHICKLYQVIESESHFFLIMEYCSGGELFDHIVERNRLSESESRMFFRQIVSAVAYLHSLGYAHRDLKPENVLLDKDQNLKLIDFGLCARPEGGIENPLFTSCGSPTYAAPELVLGKKYQGPEVDVWAMGVLLFALLAGALPFDDVNVDNLYKKILSGKYEEPRFISKESKSLIKSMLQVDPKKRITVTELLSHPWLTLGILDPVDYRPLNAADYDSDCLHVMASFYDVSLEKMWRYVKKYKYDYSTATYYLLQSKKKRGSPLKLNSLPNHLRSKIKLQDTPRKVRVRPRPLNVIQLGDVEEKLDRNERASTPTTPYHDCVFSPFDVENLSPVMPNNVQKMQSPAKFSGPARLIARKPLKRARSPTFSSDGSPVPTKKLTTRKSTSTPETKPLATPNAETPGSARRVLDGIEKSLNKVRHVLTPRKPRANAPNEPVVLSSKNLCNVSTTQCNDPEYVITELFRVFQKKGFHCNRKGFILRGKVERNVLHPGNGCSFELEICYLPRMGPLVSTQNYDTPPKSILKNGVFNTPTTSAVPTPSKKKEIVPNDLPNKGKTFAFVGIRRKRLKGDSWCYKKVCEEVLAVATKDLRSVTESMV